MVCFVCAYAHLIVHHIQQQHQQHRQQQQQSALCWTRSNAINWVKTVFSSSSSFLSLLRLTACKQTTTRNPLTSCSPDTPEMPTKPIGRVKAGNQSLLIINVIDAWNSIARWRPTSEIECEKENETKYAAMTSTMHTSHFTRHSFIMIESIGYCFSDCDGRWENAEETVVWNY